ncbi:MAG: shikimate kinase [Aeoliella sp.]
MSRASNVFLIGYRGTGKTSVARQLGALRGSESIDSDDLVEQRAGKSIAQVFADDGEQSFRAMEEEVVANLCGRRGVVVALGGGAVMRPKTRERLATSGVVVWLTGEPATLAARIAGDTTTADRRPSLSEMGLLAEIEQVLSQRKPIYQECATFVIDTEGKSPTEVAEEIERRLSKSD